MAGLSAELQQLVATYRSAKRPSDADTAHILEGLRARLGDGTITGPDSADAATSTSTGLLVGKGVLASLAGLAVLGGVWFFATLAPRAAPSEANSTASAATTASADIGSNGGVTTSSATPAPEPAGSQAPVVPSSAPARVSTRAVAPHPARDRLAEEVVLLSRAQAALRSGRPAAALVALNEHEREFGNGLLVEERIAARARALCALGRDIEADAQLARLSPKSLHGQARKACSSRRTTQSQLPTARP